MELSELKLITASNIIKLRTGAGMTQAELGAALNYSDKTISKWERGEAIPDAYVLTQMGELFGVTVDELLSSHTKWEPAPEVEGETEHSYSVGMIIAVTVLGVWTLALTAFVALWLVGIIRWQIFAVALPISVLTYLVLICVFGRKRHLQYVIACFVFSLFISVYLLFVQENPWQIFLICALAEVLVFLSCNIKRRPKFLKKRKNAKDL